MATKKNGGFPWGFVSLVVFCLMVWSLLPDRWTDPLRYSGEYSINTDQVHSSDRPTDCEWMHAPLGGKGCHYERSVIGLNAAGDVVMVPDDPHDVVFGTDPKTGKRIVSFDEGKTWYDLNAPPKSVDVKVSSVQIKWIKVKD